MDKNIRPKDWTGIRCGRLLVIKNIGLKESNEGHRRTYYLVKCDCGTEKEIMGNSLSRIKSCGCEGKEKTILRNSKHGSCVRGNVSTEYISWAHMKQRCLNPKDKKYPRYGGRGITICDRWVNSYESFIEDMGEKPGDEYSIDRIDLDGNYEPSNCRWATTIEQQNNTSTNRYIEHNGEVKTLAQWSRHLGITQAKLWKFLCPKWRTFKMAYDTFYKKESLT